MDDERRLLELERERMGINAGARPRRDQTYDASGNLTALQRHRETATLIDNLTYAYPGSSNRLSSVSDAVGGTAETWDAETGSFTHDANGMSSPRRHRRRSPRAATTIKTVRCQSVPIRTS